MQYKQSYVYILANKHNTVLYTGVTRDLKRRIYEHKQKFVKSFTSKYNVDKLVYYEVFDDIYNAITREKQIKGGSRKKKIDMINSMNETWKDLYYEIWNPKWTILEQALSRRCERPPGSEAISLQSRMGLLRRPEFITIFVKENRDLLATTLLIEY